jgi:hypothetical protein
MAHRREAALQIFAGHLRAAQHARAGRHAGDRQQQSGLELAVEGSCDVDLGGQSDVDQQVRVTINETAQKGCAAQVDQRGECSRAVASSVAYAPS